MPVFEIEEKNNDLVIIGKMESLPDNREVFVGKKQGDDSGTLFIRFVNEDGDKTFLRLSEEASKILHKLIGIVSWDEKDYEGAWRITNKTIVQKNKPKWNVSYKERI
jgi:hypothetical protein